MKRRASLMVATLGVAAIVLTACSGTTGTATPSSSSTSSKAPLTFAVLQGVTGIYASNSQGFLVGVKTAVDQLNSKGGVDGHQVEYKTYDTQSDPTHAVSVLTGILSSGQKPDVVVPGGVSPEVLALLPLLTQSQVFSVSPASNPLINDPTSYPYHFSVSPTSIDALQILASQLKKIKAKTVAIISSNDASGQGFLAGFQAAAKLAGAKIVDTESPDASALSMNVEFQRMVAAKPDAIMGDIASAPGVGVMFASREAVGAGNIPLLVGTNANSIVPIRVADKAAVQNCTMPTPSFTVQKNPVPANLKPLATAISEANVPNESAYAPGLGYDTIMVAALAFERAHDSSSAAALSKAAINLHMAKDYSLLFPNGYVYTKDSHFPALTPGFQAMIPCDASLVDGFWQTSSK